MPKITFVNEKKEIEVPEGAILRDEAIKAGIQINFLVLDLPSGKLGKVLNCRGHGSCGSCQVRVKKGMDNLGPRSKIEKIKLAMMLSTIGHEDETRLACQTRVNGDCSIETRPPFNWSGENFWQKPYPNK